MAALRFVIDAEGGYTVVEGEKVPMHNGDLILTPGWTWHDHKNESRQRPMVWLDALDAPFTRGSLQATFYQDYPNETSQPVTKGVAESMVRYGGPGLLPAGSRPQSLHSPLNVYRWDDAYGALRRLQQHVDDDADGTVLEYVNPVTGGHVLPTMACNLQLLGMGKHTRAVRATTSSVYYVVKGSGQSIIAGERLDWAERDVFVVPTWAWREHVVSRDEDAVLFSVTDLPVIEAFGLVREESYELNGGHQSVGS
jgi:gentisate 1,2-dioxygenase